jgi:hypothetical protein
LISAREVTSKSGTISGFEILIWIFFIIDTSHIRILSLGPMIYIHILKHSGIGETQMGSCRGVDGKKGQSCLSFARLLTVTVEQVAWYSVGLGLQPMLGGRQFFPPDKRWNSTLVYATAASFPILSNSLFANNSVVYKTEINCRGNALR